MGVMNTIKVGGGGGGETSAVKTPFALLHQVTSGSATFKEWTFTTPHYVTSLEILPFNANGAIDNSPAIDVRVYNLQLNGVEMWQDTVLQNGDVMHIRRFFDEPIGLTQLYASGARLDGLTNGLRMVLRGYTLA